MISFARRGKCVARVKGGDPLIFARIGEELEKLSEADIDVTIINGITAGLAASAALGIPLTHRDYSHSITFVTGKSREGVQPNWQALAQSGSTLVIYMGMRTLRGISERLIDGGMSATMPVAVIQNATLPHQHWLITTLAQLPEAVKKKDLGSPAIIVVGKVVELAQILSVGEIILSHKGGLP
jgi:uroporphyrin-III C-methyltransferase